MIHFSSLHAIPLYSKKWIDLGCLGGTVPALIIKIIVIMKIEMSVSTCLLTSHFNANLILLIISKPFNGYPTIGLWLMQRHDRARIRGTICSTTLVGHHSYIVSLFITIATAESAPLVMKLTISQNNVLKDNEVFH